MTSSVFLDRIRAIISSRGEEKDFPPKRVQVSVEALLAAAPDVALSHLEPGTGTQSVSNAAKDELMKLAQAMADAAREA